MLRRLLKISIVIFLIYIVVVGLVSIRYPIILKWSLGSARVIGKAKLATIYADGKVNNNIQIFHVDKYWNGEKANYYLVHFPLSDTKETREFISLNLQDNYVGRASCTNKQDYEIIFGILFQSHCGALFTPFTDDMKGYNFEPRFTFTNKQLKLNLPPDRIEFNYDSIRVEL